jgi:hypothetical protein
MHFTWWSWFDQMTFVNLETRFKANDSAISPVKARWFKDIQFAELTAAYRVDRKIIKNSRWVDNGEVVCHQS